MMGDYGRGSLNLEDDDRLPWLEPADREEDNDGVSPLKLLAFILTGLIALGAIVGIVYWVQSRNIAAAVGDAQLIAAPPGDYKGDASFAASEGVERAGKIDPSRVPEAPVTGGPTPAPAQTAKVTGAKPAARFSAPVADETRRPANAQPAAGTKGSGAMIQLGAYGSQSSAKDAWGRLSKRFDYLASLGTSVESVKVGDTTLYRLRASAGSASQASALCGKLRVAGESCLVVN